jgi:hypothetical protein
MDIDLVLSVEYTNIPDICKLSPYLDLEMFGRKYNLLNNAEYCIVFECPDNYTIAEPDKSIKSQINTIMNSKFGLKKRNYIVYNNKSHMFSYNRCVIIPNETIICVFKISESCGRTVPYKGEIFQITSDIYCKVANLDIRYCYIRRHERTALVSPVYGNIDLSHNVGIIFASRVSLKNKITILYKGTIMKLSDENKNGETFMIYLNLIQGHTIKNFTDLFKMSHKSFDILNIIQVKDIYLIIREDIRGNIREELQNSLSYIVINYPE